MTTGAPVDTREWWERAAERRSAWWARHPDLSKMISRVSNGVIWFALVVLVLALLFWPVMANGVRVWSAVAWMALCWAAIARTRTVRTRSLLRVMSLSTTWSFGIAALTWWLTVGPAGLDSPKSVAAAVVIAPIGEEVLKLAPLAVLAVLAPGRVRRFAVADWAMIGFASGLGFMLSEESMRRIAVVHTLRSDPEIAASNVCGVADGSPSFGCMGMQTFGLNPFSGHYSGGHAGYGGAAAYAGHAVLTALVAVSIGIGVRLLRERSAGTSRKVVAVGIPVVAFFIAVVDHVAHNAGADRLWGDLGSPPPVISWFHWATGAGHGRELVLITLLLVGMSLDAAVCSRASVVGALMQPPERQLEQLYLAGRASAVHVEHRLARALTSAIDLTFLVARDLRDIALSLWAAAPELPPRQRAAHRVRGVRELWERQRSQREDAQRGAFDSPPVGRGRTRWAAITMSVVGLGLVLVVTPLVASVVDAGVSATAHAEFGWLAGVLQSVGEWWNQQPLATKIAAAAILAAVIVASGGSLGFALGAASTTWSWADQAGDVGRVLKNPRKAIGDYLSNNSPGDIAIDAGLLAASALPIPARFGKALSRALKRSEGARPLRNEIDDLPASRRAEPRVTGEMHGDGTTRPTSTRGDAPTPDTAAVKREAAWEKYLGRKNKEGKPPLDRDAWDKKYDTLQSNSRKGAVEVESQMTKRNIRDGENGWLKEFNYEVQGGQYRRYDFANPERQIGYEVKSGSNPGSKGLEQMARDERAVLRGWRITWLLRDPLSSAQMQRLRELVEKYPGRFNYEITGGN